MEFSTEKYNETKIDLVYMWVDGNDPQQESQRLYWQEKLNIPVSESNNPHKYQDHEELRYSLRSAMQNAPWIRKIFIVTNGQIPRWLELSKTDKIEIITHEQIMPKDALPTFNSCSIEYCIHNIPDLSEYFLLANDDCFFYRYVKPDFFFTKTGMPIARLKKEKISKYKAKHRLYDWCVDYSNQLINRKYKKRYSFVPQHNIDAYSKSMYKECILEFRNDFDKMIHSKFRTEGVQRVIFSLYMLAKNKCKLKNIKTTHLYKHQDSLFIEISGLYMLDRIRKATPYLLCLNDSCRVNEADIKTYKYFLEYLFPKAQEYESVSIIDSDSDKIIQKIKKYDKKFNLLWKIFNKLLFLFIAPIKFLLDLTIETDKDDNYKEFKIFKIIKITIKRKKKERD